MNGNYNMLTQLVEATTKCSVSGLIDLTVVKCKNSYPVQTQLESS